MFGYSTAVRSLSQGRASYTMEPLEYAAAPDSLLEVGFLDREPRTLTGERRAHGDLNTFNSHARFQFRPQAERACLSNLRGTFSMRSSTVRSWNHRQWEVMRATLRTCWLSY